MPFQSGVDPLALNVAVTVEVAAIENEQLPVPEQLPPLHPENVEPLPGVSVHVIVVPEE